MDSIFGFGLCIWTTVFLARYEQLLNLKIFRWGMSGVHQEIVPVRKEFSDEYRGTIRESLQKISHWILCGIFIMETISVVWYLTHLRKDILDNPDDVTFGIPNTTMILLYKYALTLNIKIVDLIWTPLSTWLSRKENFRTDIDLKSSMVVKLFVVKFMVYYYPFAYTIFIQPYEEGCDGGEFRGCLLKLRQDLQVLFLTQVACKAFEVVLAVLMTYWTVHSELKNRRQDKDLTYLELQAMMPEYGEAEQIEDYMQLALNFGFIAMFGVTCPVICILCFLSNFVVKRLLAYKLCYAHRRVLPRVEEGIGSWNSILIFIAYMGVTCTCYIVFFVFNLENLPFKIQLIAFILSERAMMALKYAMERFLGSKTVAQLRVEEHNEEVLDRVLQKTDVESAAALTSLACAYKP
ncbi:ANO5 [Symbiodinium pilosum]|uniref:ANO5 protein n=1 Tax=Symbiodinium pilosum TaxID=2952 RepID=A0A812PJ89_SYMPI|nr:ANO5 [Symbiodinium pilosum]